MQPHAGQAAHEHVEDTARPDLVNRIVADTLPSADDVQPFIHLREKARDLLRIVLQIAIERENDVVRSSFEPSTERGRLAEVAAQTNPTHARIFRRELLDQAPGVVGRAVIDKDDLQFEVRRLRDLTQLRV